MTWAHEDATYPPAHSAQRPPTLISVESHCCLVRGQRTHAHSPTSPQRRICVMAPRRSASVHLSLISNNNVPPHDAQKVLIAAFRAKDYLSCIKNLDKWKIDPQAYIDGLDQVRSRPFILRRNTLTAMPHQIIDTLPLGSEIYHRSLRALRKTCGIYGLLPSSHFISGELTLITAGNLKRPFASGGYSDVWKARDDVGDIFAVKQLRVYIIDNQARVKKVSTSGWPPTLSSCIVPYQSLFPRDIAKRSPSVGE